MHPKLTSDWKPTSYDQRSTQAKRKWVDPPKGQPTITDTDDEAMRIDDQGVRQNTLHTYKPTV